LLSQLLGCLAALLLAMSGLTSEPWALVSLQAATAAAISPLLRSDPWWIALHIVFTPLLYATLSIDIDPRWYLGISLALMLAFWGTPSTRVPLYLSGQDAIEAVDNLLPDRRPLRFLDLGCGTGTMLIPLAQRHPDCHFTGVENAPLPWLIACVAAHRLSNVTILRGNFFKLNWRNYDVLYAFLSSHPMKKVEDKARQELREHALLICKDFPAPGLSQKAYVQLRSGGSLHAYHPSADKSN
jgi:SAM-dependent methyltransferase